MKDVLLVGIGGFFGSLSRFGLGRLYKALTASTFPLATLSVNVMGSFMIGFLFEVFQNHPFLPQVTLFLIIGFLGAFTTFSAFSFETMSLFKSHEVALALANIGLNVGLCLIGVFAGESCGKVLNSTSN